MATPDSLNAQAYFDRGLALFQARRLSDAAAAFQRCLDTDPSFAEAAANLGETLRRMGRLSESLKSHERALALNPRLAAAELGRGLTLLDLGDVGGALQSLTRATDLDPTFVEAQRARARILELQGDRAAAISCLRTAVRLRPQRVDALYALAAALHRDGQHQEALRSYEEVLSIDPTMMDARLGRAEVLETRDRLVEAASEYDTALSMRADDTVAVAGRLSCAVRMCDWPIAERTLAQLRSLPRGIEAISPLLLAALSDDLNELWRASSTSGQRLAKVSSVPDENKRIRPVGERIRLAYLSSDFREHATSHLIAELIELHDRRAFEVLCISIGPDDGSALRARVARGCDRFVDAQTWGTRAVADWIRSEQIDIAVDLNGYIERSRPDILASRPAPVQVSYLGFPATMAADHIDYLIADGFVIPEAHRSYYREAVVEMPDCYQVNDRQRPLPDLAIARESLGLPATGFVFCCFNNSWKITAPIFDAWMRILAETDDAVLWLLDSNPSASDNLRERARASGIPHERVVFAPRVARKEHLARHGAADLFLDTFPYNAHTTASDALWCGVPVLTCAGRSFPSRVAGSLLCAVGLSQLILPSLVEYREAAVALARDRQRVRQLHDHLLNHRLTLPLFDTPRFCGHLEGAYRHMLEVARAGEPRGAFRVPHTDSFRPRRMG
jgi:predicted O-linked N-acetylglucosamine transferase (SPINDLY family)